MLNDDDVKMSVQRLLAFWLTVLVGVVLVLALCAVLGMVTGGLRPVIEQGHSYYGGYVDHRL
jgi:hypothetical protein